MLLPAVLAANPIVPHVGMADPHIHVWPSDPDTCFLYATHDCSPSGSDPCTVRAGSLGFRMTSWWVWSSSNMVNWTLVNEVRPSQIRWEGNSSAQECWATDAASFPGGRTFFYLSVGPSQIGVVTGPSPSGPFNDPLGKPLVPKGMVPSDSRDPGVLMDSDGECFLVWGTFNYFIAKLNKDMISFAEKPRPVTIVDVQHRDDKPFLHVHGGMYYLSWGCFYAMGTSPYGPFTYQGSIVDAGALANTSFASGGGTTDRHGSFFTFRNQTYFACNDRSHGGNAGYRSTIIAYVHYLANGSIAPLRIDEVGVGQYNVHENSVIAASEYFASDGAKAQVAGKLAFEVQLPPGGFLSFPRVHGAAAGAKIQLWVANGNRGAVAVTVRAGTSASAPELGACTVPPTGSWISHRPVTCGVVSSASTFDLFVEVDSAAVGGLGFSHIKVE